MRPLIQKGMSDGVISLGRGIMAQTPPHKTNLQDVRYPVHRTWSDLDICTYLPLTRGSLIDASFSQPLKSGNCAFSLLTAGLHFRQLPAHGVQLAVEREIVRDTYPDRRSGEKGNPERSVGGSTGRTVGGIFMLVLGAALLKLCFYISDGRALPDGVFGWGVLAGAFWLIAQGTWFGSVSV